MDKESEDLDKMIAGCVKKPESIDISLQSLKTGGQMITYAWRRWRAPTEPTPVTVLEPDHPLMQKFQKALKTYLLKENERIAEQIIDLKSNLKKRKRDYENQMSKDMYHLEQDVKHQRDTIKQFEENLENTVKFRENKDQELQQIRGVHREKTNYLEKRKREDMELQKDLDEYNWIWKQYEKRKNETDCELAVSKRVSEKMTSEKKEKAQKQKDLDVMMYKLTTEVWNLESKISLTGEQTQIKKDEMDLLNIRIAESTADMDSLQVEHSRLMNAWTSVIKQIEKRDQVYTKLSEEYNEMEANFHVINAEIEGVKKEITKAMTAHEHITACKDKVNYDLENVEKLIKIDEKKKIDFESAMIETNTILEITENDLDQATTENTSIENILKVIVRELEKLSQTKFDLENETLEKLQESLLNDKASGVIAATIKKLKEQVKKLELSVLTNENLQAKISLQIEQQKDKNERLQRTLEEEKKQCDMKDRDVTKVDENIKDTLTSIERKQNLLENANKKLAILLEQLQGVEASPAQRRVDELEKNISDLTNQLKDLQLEWVRSQTRVVNLSDQKQNLSTEVNKKRKQIQVLEHKNLKLENEISILNKDKNSMHRALNSLQQRMEHLFEQRSEDHKHNEELEASYNHMTLEYIAHLKDTEEEALKIEEEVKELEEEKSQLEIDLHKTKREAMTWQKMVILTNETKQKIMEERGAEGDVGKMKIEIHRMQVRQAQLTRLANRLADELAQGVVRREIAAEKATADPKRKRMNIPYSIKEKRSNICQLTQEMEERKQLIVKMQSHETQLQGDISEKVNIIANIENHTEQLKMELEDLQDAKQKNLEHLVRIQHCGQLWSTIAGGRNLPAGRLADPQSELARQTQFTRSLKTFIGHLIKLQGLDDTQKRKLQRACNTLKTNENVVSDNV